MFKSPLKRAAVPARRNALLTSLGKNLPKQSCCVFFCASCQSLYLGVRLKLRCNVSAYILPIGLFLTTVNVLGTCSQTTGNNRPHPSLRVPLSPSALWGSRLGTPTISMLWNQEGNKAEGESLQHLLGTDDYPLPLMKGGWNTVIFYFLNSVSLSRMASTLLPFQFVFFLFVRHSVGLW